MTKHLKKGMAVLLAAAMVFSTPLAVNTSVSKAAFEEGTVVTDMTYEGDEGLVDGTGGWNSKGLAPIAILDGATTVVTFDNDPYTNGDDNWLNFVIETNVPTGYKGVSMRGDAYGWSYGGGDDVYVVNRDTGEKEVLGGFDTTGNTFGVLSGTFEEFHDACIGEVKVEASKTDTTHVQFKIIFKDDSTETYVIEYPAGVPDDLAFYIGADGASITQKSIAFNVSLIKNPKAVVSGGSIEASYELVSESVVPEVTVKVGEETLPEENGKYHYTPTESGTYKFDFTATLGEAVETTSTSISVAVENGSVVYDADLISNLQVTDGGEVYNITWSKVFEDVSCTAVVSDGTKTIATFAESGGQIKKSDMTSGTKYTVTLTATKEGYASKTLTGEVTYTAPKEGEAGSKPGTDLSKISTKPVLSYTFDNADGIELAGDAAVKDGVLNLANSITQKNKTYAKIGDLSSYDFSNGFTWTADVKVNATNPSSHDWTSILMLGDSTPGNEMKGDSATVGYHFTTALSSFVDIDAINGKADNNTTKLGMCGSGVVFKYDGTSAEGAATGLNEYSFANYEWYKDPSKCGRWDTITVTLTKDTMTLYYDGQAKLTYTDPDYIHILEAAKKFTSNYVGTSYWGGDFDFSGSIDNLAFYNTALSAEDVGKLTTTTADNKEVKPVIEDKTPKKKSMMIKSLTAKLGSKKVSGEVNASNATVEVKVGKAAYKKAKVSGKKFSLTLSKKLTKGTKVTVRASADGYTTATKSVTIKGTMKLSGVKAKKGSTKVTGKVSVKKATVKVKVGKKKYKKAKVKGKKFTFKCAKLKKGTKVKIQVTKKNYKTVTKTVKVK